MTTTDIKRLETSLTGNSFIYQLKLILTPGEITGAYMLPIVDIRSISCIVTVSSTEVYSTNANKEDIISEVAGIWSKWDGTSQFNNSITAIKVINPTSASTLIFTIRAGN